MLDLKKFLKIMVERKASDLYLTTGALPSMKINGRMSPVDEQVVGPGEVAQLALSIMNEKQALDFKNTQEMNLAITEPDIGRFRVNIFIQKTETGLVIRSISTQIPTLESLGLPKILREVIMSKRGLILMVGATGSGKSTSLASLVDYRNTHGADHIVTIEDPIEFIHHHKKSIITQREVGMDTLSYEHALENTLRQAPDVILIGEIRTAEAMEYAMAFAETGHLCLSTLHANNANQAFDRILNFFPQAKHAQIKMDLSLTTRAIISQRLIPTIDGKRAAAIEILLGTPLVSDLIRKGEFDVLKEAMEKSENAGMQTFDMSLIKLYESGKISAQEAIENADSQNNVRLNIRLRANEGEDPLNPTDDASKADKKAPPLKLSLDLKKH